MKKFGADRFKILLEESSNRVEYQLNAILKKYDLRDDDQKVKYLQESAELICALPGSVRREVYSRRVAEQAKIDDVAMKLEVERARVRLEKRNKKKQESIDLAPARNLQPKSRKFHYDNMKSARAEEIVITLALRESALLDGIGSLTEEKFSSELLGKVFSQILRRHREGLDVTLGGLTGFEPEEMSHIAGLLRQQEGPINEQAFHDSIRLILDEKQAKTVSSDEELLARQQSLKQRKGIKA